MNCLRLFQFAQRRAANISKTTSIRCISGQHLKYMEMQDRLREKDGLSKGWQLIYRAPMENALKYVTTYLTVTTSGVALGSLYYSLFVFDPANWDAPVIIGDNVLIANNSLEGLTYVGAFILFHIATKILISRFVVRLYQRGDNYVAFFRGNWYNSLNKHEFHRKEVKKLSPTFVVSWGDARYGLGKKHGILLENYFKTPQYLNYLLGSSDEHPDDD